MTNPSVEAMSAANKILDRWESTMRPVPTSDELRDLIDAEYAALRERVERLERLLQEGIDLHGTDRDMWLWHHAARKTLLGEDVDLQREDEPYVPVEIAREVERLSRIEAAAVAYRDAEEGLSRDRARYTDAACKPLPEQTALFATLPSSEETRRG